jgi:NADPH:quinone reductase-like Zn-dependent oxidoreductase
MKRVIVERFGGPEVLKVVEADDPRPGHGEVLVKVLAAGVSFTDSQLRAGTYLPGAPKPPFTPGYELVGVVEELGPGCSRLRVGDRIGALTVWGADAERVCVPEAGAVAIDYQNEDFLKRVRELPGRGVDVVLDSLGGPISLRSFRALRPGGRLVVFGRYNTIKDGRKDWPAVIKWWASIATVWLWDKLSPRRRVSSYHVQRYRDKATRRDGAVGGEPMDPEWFREDLAVLLELLRADKIHPVVAERLPLSEARRAHELLESSAAKGKLVLVP